MPVNDGFSVAHSRHPFTATLPSVRSVYTVHYRLVPFGRASALCASQKGKVHVFLITMSPLALRIGWYRRSIGLLLTMNLPTLPVLAVSAGRTEPIEVSIEVFPMIRIVTKKVNQCTLTRRHLSHLQALRWAPTIYTNASRDCHFENIAVLPPMGLESIHRRPQKSKGRDCLNKSACACFTVHVHVHVKLMTTIIRCRPRPERRTALPYVGV